MLEKFTQICKASNLNITPQRILIYNELLAHQDHPDAETIYRRVKKQFPTISLATIYKTLDTFAELGLLSRFRSVEGSLRIDMNMEQHHHLVCVRCDRVFDIEHRFVSDIHLDSIPVGNFKVLNHQIEIKGICENCQRNQSTKKTI